MKLNWKRTFIILTDVVLGIYIVLAFTAFNKPDETAKKCTRVNISIADESNNGFITVAEIKKRLVAGGIYPKTNPQYRRKTKLKKNTNAATKWIKRTMPNQ